mmetsp:Transcript_19366/g.42783  ORF Transcript_19366/g.42783 Transcript_19366/m.42783 type:complete len:244 (+) Transcript_19366:1740-2471(+)
MPRPLSRWFSWKLFQWPRGVHLCRMPQGDLCIAGGALRAMCGRQPGPVDDRCWNFALSRYLPGLRLADPALQPQDAAGGHHCLNPGLAGESGAESAGHQHRTYVLASLDAGHDERVERHDAEPGALGRPLRWPPGRGDRVLSAGLGLSRYGWHFAGDLRLQPPFAKRPAGAPALCRATAGLAWALRDQALRALDVAWHGLCHWQVLPSDLSNHGQCWAVTHDVLQTSRWPDAQHSKVQQHLLW